MSRARLHQYPPVGAMRSLSPYCWKVQMALVAKGIEYDVHDTLNPKRANPLGKLPYLELDGRGYEELGRHLDSLETRLSDRQYLVGDGLTIADLSVTAMIGQLTVGLTPSFAKRIAERERLNAYLGRVFEQTAGPLA